jgi:hypothetical protein
MLDVAAGAEMDSRACFKPDADHRTKTFADSIAPTPRHESTLWPDSWMSASRIQKGVGGEARNVDEQSVVNGTIPSAQVARLHGVYPGYEARELSRFHLTDPIPERENDPESRSFNSARCHRMFRVKRVASVEVRWARHVVIAVCS